MKHPPPRRFIVTDPPQTKEQLPARSRLSTKLRSLRRVPHYALPPRRSMHEAWHDGPSPCRTQLNGATRPLAARVRQPPPPLRDSQLSPEHSGTGHIFSFESDTTFSIAWGIR
ncbi:hypothetical protein NW768_011636 [Fusarium equiseti]|uniref:Uncharacterized protein n=1 Tax=Fusarium equiseti TaxID=61235 RepID=A0ABQ8QXL6_FUSEQ|nr:hypothetical protein NW768_011636 [Fusarium equiseti]